ncbi:MAG TPA: multidrug effflux MFS transporter [Beutenbergiaceae bacterium]|nr:multidrug effflux MFS transporter [Beutenbergiaceae bacterium]
MTALTNTAPLNVRAAARARRISMTKWVLLLGSMAALGAMTTDMYLPSLPEVARELGTGMPQVQFTIAGTLIGGAAGQLFIGPMSDRFGRRTPVFVGLVVHVIASLLCAITFSVAPLFVLRMFQGVGNAAAGVVAIAVIRDRMSGAEASGLLSRLMLVIGIAPLLAPTVGAALAHMWGWRSIFIVLATLGMSLLVLVWKFLPETLPAEKRITSTREVMVSYRVLLGDRRFLAYALLPGLAQAALFAYVAGSPFVLREGFNLTPGQFSLLFAANGLGLVIAAQVNAALVKKFAPVRIMRLAAPFAALFALALFVTALTGFGGIFGLLIPLFFLLTANAFIPPNASALALTRHGDRAGGAAAFIGAVQAGTAGLMAPAVGMLGGDGVAMASVILGSVLVSVTVLSLTGVYRRGGWTANHPDEPELAETSEVAGDVRVPELAAGSEPIAVVDPDADVDAVETAAIGASAEPTGAGAR